MKKSNEPLRGEAAWLAAKADMNKRNEAARNRAEKEGAATERRAAAQRRVLAKQEMANLPSQPKSTGKSRRSDSSQ